MRYLKNQKLKWVVSMLQKAQAYWAENPGSLVQFGLCLAIFAGCYIFSRVVRYQVAPWLVE